jgi:hypothetical protein
MWNKPDTERNTVWSHLHVESKEKRSRIHELENESGPGEGRKCVNVG